MHIAHNSFCLICSSLLLPPQKKHQQEFFGNSDLQYSPISHSHSRNSSLRHREKKCHRICERYVKGKLTSLICKALILAWTTSGASVMLVNFISSGRVRYNRSFRSSWAFLALTTSTEPSVNQPMPRNHSRSDLYTFYK